VGLSTPGLGSGLDVNSIVSQLMAVEQRPLTLLATKEASYQAKLTAYGTLKGALSSFQSAVHGIVSASTFQGVQVTPSDTTVASATATADATPGNYTLSVTQRAQAQKMVAAGAASDTATIGAATTSTVTFDFGTVDIGTGSFSSVTGHYTDASFTSSGAGVKTVTIDSSNNSLAGIRDAINSANIGVTATIVNDGSTSPYRLALTNNTTGKTNSMKISVSGDADIATLLGHDPTSNTGQGFSQTTAAQNAEFSVDGIAVSKTTNTVTDVLKGVTINLLKDGVSSTNIAVSRNTSGVINSVTAFVKAFNDINKNLVDAQAYDATTKTAALLNGEATVRSMQARIRSVLSAPVAGGASAFSVLSQIGVSFQKDGTLAVNSTKLQAAITSNFNDIAGLFATVGKATDSLVGYTSATSKTVPGAYAVTVSQLARQSSATGSAAAANPGHGKITGSAVAGLIISGSNNTIDVNLDGVSASVTLLPATYGDADALAAHVQTQINAAFVGKTVTVSQAGGVLKITSDATGTSSAASITGGNGKTNLLGAAPAVIAGSQTSVTAGVNDTLQVQLDGLSASVTLSAGNYSFAALAAEIQAKINGVSAFSAAASSVTVTQSSGIMTLLSARYGAASSVIVSGGNGKTDLFGASPTTISGLDVAGTINGAMANASGQFLTGSTGDGSEGLTIKISGGSIGSRGTVNYSQGYAYQFDQLAIGMLASDGSISSRTIGINASLKGIASDKLHLNTQLAVTEKRLRAQFTALDTAISSMKTTSDFLTQQLANLTKSTA
jgi:flagellar hook-associated protein 2